MTTQNDIIEFLENFVDLLMPELTPHEASMYIFLYRNSFLLSDNGKVRIGQRTIAQKYGRGPKMAVPSRTHVTRQLEQLQKKGCIKIGDTTREGTLYTVIEPKKIPLVIEKISTTSEPTIEDYYTDNAKRHELYERDNWHCQYCGEKVNKDNITLDHYIPQHIGGGHSKENLKTACLLCNSIKSGKTFEDAAVLLLKSISDRKIKK